jgi:ligand-binding sensor domain-containing protein
MPRIEAPKAAPFVNFTDTVTASSLAITSDQVLAATERGLLAFSRSTGAAQWLGAPEEEKPALSSVVVHEGAVYVVGKGVAGRLSLGSWTRIPATESTEHLGVSADGAVWLGGKDGLSLVSSKGIESKHPGEVRMLQSHAGGLWVASGEGLLEVRAQEAKPVPGWERLSLRSVCSVGGTIIAVGDEGTSEARVLWFGKAGKKPEKRALSGVARVIGDGSCGLSVGRRLYHSVDRRREKADVPLGKTWVGFHEIGIDQAEPLALAIEEKQVWSASPSLGVASFGASAQRLALRDLLGAGEHAFLGSSAGGDVFVAMDGPWVGRLMGDRFVRMRVEESEEGRVLAVASNQAGEIFALSQPKSSGAIQVRRWNGTSFVVAASLRLSSMPALPRVRCFEVSAEGELWFSVLREDGLGAGLVWVSADLRESEHLTKSKEAKRGPLAGLRLPSDAVAQVRLVRGAVWIATNSGLVWRRGANVRIFAENDSLDSEIVHDIAVDRLDLVWLATGDGVGVLQQGGRWNFSRYQDVLGERRVRALLSTGDGTMWVGTDEGVFALVPSEKRAEGEWKHLRTAEGLCGEKVLDLAEDAQGRVWYLTASGFCVPRERGNKAP